MATYKYNEDKLMFEKTYKVLKYKLMCSFLFFLAVFLGFSAFKNPTKEYVHTEITVKTDNSKIETSIMEKVDELPFKYKNIIKAQILLETGHFKSSVFKSNFNLFGMRLAKSRITLAIGDNLNHAVYRSWEESMYDRLIYDVKYMSKLNREEYFALLDKIYAEGDGYSKMLKQIIKSNKL